MPAVLSTCLTNGRGFQTSLKTCRDSVCAFVSGPTVLQLDAFTLLVACSSPPGPAGTDPYRHVAARPSRNGAAVVGNPLYRRGRRAHPLRAARCGRPTSLRSASAILRACWPWAAIWQGVRVFNGRGPLPLVLLGFSALWALLCLRPEIIESLSLRVAIISFLTAVLCGLSAHELWRNRAEALASRTPADHYFRQRQPHHAGARHARRRRAVPDRRRVDRRGLAGRLHAGAVRPYLFRWRPASSP